ncbi:anoctamin-4-like, partial [Macrosteles quadrilineatus]|uniref:anoctamin-4-like n=1 Tax=Macrosteles quadrilineatus TaxID=74068 RepID=UPI0023E0B8E2
MKLIPERIKLIPTNYVEKGKLKMNNQGYTEKQWTFKDGERTIDMVIVWDESSHKAHSKRASDKRTIFETNLREEGLELEHETVPDSGLHFIKIHAPMETLQRYAEILKMQMPVKNLSITTDGQSTRSTVKSCCRILCPFLSCCELNPEVFPDCGKSVTASYSRARDFLFDVGSPGFFTSAQKSRIVQFILERTLYTKKGKINVFEFGINRLVLHGVYTASYPLHDGDLETPGSLRYRFYHYWASFKNWYKKQPADHIRQYFGVKTALYFLWLGYYTKMLIPASVVAVVCFVTSILLLPSAVTIDEVCDGAIKDVMCPLCDRYCKFVNISDTCLQTEILYIFDNSTTVVFAVFISFWAAIFLECWKRYSAEITLRWDLTSLDDRDENPRPEYAAKLSKLTADKKVSHKLNFITNASEPNLSFWMIFPGKVISITTVLLLVSLAVAAVIGVTLYHMFALTALPLGIISSISATCLNLICILMFSPIYSKLSLFLTEMEMPRTQREFDSSLTLKMYMLEFINHYSSIFYIAFFKGKFTGHPSGYFRVFGFRQLECGAGGCMLELSQQLAVIMIGKRAFRTLSQILRPIITLFWRKRFSSFRRSWDDREISQWEKDFLLTDGGPRTLFPEYLDMVLQYGFVTIFVSAFPLAPLFALINNILEIRIDSQKLLIYHRRPTLRRTKDIGIWFDILKYISHLAVFTNGFIIAFTSNFIPRMVYRVAVSQDYGTAGFLNRSLSYMALQDLDMVGKPNTTLEYCRYFDYREPPWSDNKYEETKLYWMVLAARLTFFIVFENMIMMAVMLVKWLIPDIPQTVKWQMRRKHYLINEMIISHESKQK